MLAGWGQRGLWIVPTAIRLRQVTPAMGRPPIRTRSEPKGLGIVPSACRLKDDEAARRGRRLEAGRDAWRLGIETSAIR